MNYLPVVSSQISHVGYDIDSKTLGVKFARGGEYHYSAVPVEVAGKVVFSKSVGSTFDKLIKKGGYEYKKVENAAI